MQRVLCFSVLFTLLASFSCADPVSSPDIETKKEPSGDYYDWEKTSKPERPWLLPYHQTLVTKIFLCRKNPAGDAQQVYLTFAQALEVIKKLDNITCGIPKIVYLVGWQYDGHDSKYPPHGLKLTNVLNDPGTIPPSRACDGL